MIFNNKLLALILFLLFLLASAFVVVKNASADGAIGSISANSTITVYNSTTTLRYVGFPDWAGTIKYLSIGCGTTFYTTVSQAQLFEVECSKIQLKNTNLTEAYSYSVIYGSDAVSKVVGVSNFPTSSSGVPADLYNQISSGTSTSYFQNSWTAGELFISFWIIMAILIFIFFWAFNLFEERKVRIKKNNDF